MTAPIRRATSLRPGQFKHLIRVASVTGRLPERDVMLLWLTHTTGIRVTELALLEVADVLYPSGAIKPEVYLRADITKGCRPRNVYLTHPRCLVALDGWMAGSQFACSAAGAFPAPTNTEACGQVQSWSPHTRAKPLNSRSNIASWTVGLRCIGPATRCNRRSAGSTGRPVSNRVRLTVADAL